MDSSEARAELWERGIVAPWYLRPSQMDVYRLIITHKFPFIEAARRFGKTNSILAFVEEQLRQNPGWIARWCFPDKNQAREVLTAEISKIEQDCPDHLRTRYHTTHSYYLFANGSKLFIRGVNHDRGESARGPSANIIICDEYGFWTDPAYSVDSCLYPQLENQPGHWLIKASTPPENLGHLYYDEKELAARRGEFIQKILYDNEALSQKEIKEIIERSGGINSPAFRRERLCEAVTDPDRLVVPEYRDEVGEGGNVLSDTFPRPEFFTPYVGGDSGVDDNTAILFGYYDFCENRTVIEKEYITSGKTTSEIIGACKLIEQDLWGHMRPRLRTYDADKQLIYDIFKDHEYPVHMPDKHDKTAAIHSLRVRVGQRQFKVKESCVHLRRQLKVGLWRDEKKLDFERTEGLGHLDAVAAAIYFNRHVDIDFNPVPAHYGLSHSTHFLPPTSDSRGKTETALIKGIIGK